MHISTQPPILYFGTPVALISTVNEDNSYNLAPISSIFWLGWRCVLGMVSASKTTQNLLRTGECVINLPSQKEVSAVNLLALTTGTNPVPEFKATKGYRYEPDKFGTAGLTPMASETIKAPRIKECPVQLEARVVSSYEMGGDEETSGFFLSIETCIQRVHADESILMTGETNRIDPDKWRPLMMSFQQFYGLGSQLHASALATIPENSYHSPDLEKSKRLRIVDAKYP
jgi:flavin reductase (DIM6/NTAB) family NADH-FMN oxidoreductase RutF